MLESKFQSVLIEELRDLFPGCVILKNDPNYLQGFPDLTILYRDRWATLEVKGSIEAPRQPNQEYYVELLDGLSFSSFISPETKRGVLCALQRSFESDRFTCVS